MNNHPRDSDDDNFDHLSSESAVSGENLLDNAPEDYRAIPELDRYEAGSQDEEFHSFDFAGVRELEARLDESRRPVELPLEQQLQRRRSRRPTLEPAPTVYDTDDIISADMNDATVLLRREPLTNIGVFYQDAATIRTVGASWRQFLRRQGEVSRTDYIAQLIATRQERAIGSEAAALTIDWRDLEASSEHNIMVLRADLPLVPELILNLLGQATVPLYHDISTVYTFSSVGISFSHYTQHVSMGELRTSTIGHMVSIVGAVNALRDVARRMTSCYLSCRVCGQRTPNRIEFGPASDPAPRFCSNLNCAGNSRANSMQIDPDTATYDDVYRVRVQQLPQDTRPGTQPLTFNVEVAGAALATLPAPTAALRPGARVEVLGVFSATPDVVAGRASGQPAFDYIIRANHVTSSRGRSANDTISPADIEKLKRVAKLGNVKERIIRSIAPSIGRMEPAKRAIALAMFGGVRRQRGDQYVRGDINVLLMGDPSTGKSQLLRYATKTSPRAIFTSGKGASAVGLTAAVIRDPVTNAWTIEGGAMVMADGGTCIIDEFDKMSPNDRSAIHEALEQQTVSISKAGIITTLQARCAVIAAANPVGGIYDALLPFSANVDLGDPIISRFDVIVVSRDVVNAIHDRELTRIIVENHAEAHVAKRLWSKYQRMNAPIDHDIVGSIPGSSVSSVGADVVADDWRIALTRPDLPIPQSVLRLYIMHARDTLTPMWPDFLQRQNRIPDVYAQLREAVAQTRALPITARVINSIHRISEAFARMRLSSEVSQDDRDDAITVVIEGFCATQAAAAQQQLRNRLAGLMVGRGQYHQVLGDMIAVLVQSQVNYAQRHNGDVSEVQIPLADLQREADRQHISSDVVAGYLAQGSNNWQFDQANNRITVFLR